MTNPDIAIEKLRELQELLFNDNTSPNDVYTKYAAVNKFLKKGIAEISHILETYSNVNSILTKTNNTNTGKLVSNKDVIDATINNTIKVIEKNKEKTLSKYQSRKDNFQDSNILISLAQDLSKTTRTLRDGLNEKLQELSKLGALTDDMVSAFTNLTPTSEGHNFIKSINN